VFVTHDQEEALEVADRVVVMNRGRVEQVGSPQEVFDHPATSFVMGFLGHVNIFRGRVEGGRAVLGPLAVDWPEHAAAEPRAAAAYVRPHELDVTRAAEGEGGIWATVRHVNAAGALVKLELEAADGRVLRVEMSPERHQALAPRPGERLYVQPRRMRLFLEEGPGTPG
jgi:sulfate/thiosulfate transport system ATP-binding protein